MWHADNDKYNDDWKKGDNNDDTDYRLASVTDRLSKGVFGGGRGGGEKCTRGSECPPVVVNGNVPPSSTIKQVLQRVSQSSGFSKLS